MPNVIILKCFLKIAKLLLQRIKEKIEKNWVKTFILGKLDLRQFLKSCKITFAENLWFNR